MLRVIVQHAIALLLVGVTLLILGVLPLDTHILAALGVGFMINGATTMMHAGPTTLALALVVMGAGIFAVSTQAPPMSIGDFVGAGVAGGM